MSIFNAMHEYDDRMSQLKEALKDIQSYEELGMMSYRRIAIFAAMTLAMQLGMEANVRPVGDEWVNSSSTPDWAGQVVAYIDLPTGQVAYFLDRHGVDWDEHTRQQKLQRIRDFITGDYELDEDTDLPIEEGSDFMEDPGMSIYELEELGIKVHPLTPAGEGNIDK